MMRLLRLELHRNLARRITRIVVIVAVIGIAINGVVQFATHEKPAANAAPPSHFDATAINRQRCLQADDPFDGSQYVGGGYAFSGPPTTGTLPSSPERAALCDRFEFSNISFASDPRTFRLESLRGGLIGLTVPLVMLALLLGASYVGAEWRANTVATQLVWEPRRLRVALAKLLAAILTAIGVYVVIQAIAAGSVLPTAFLRGSTDVPDGWLGSYLGAALRGGAMVAAAAAVGNAIGSAGRNTTAAIGVAFGYLMLFEFGLVGSIWPGTRRWLVVGNAIVWVSGSTDSEIAGRSVAGAGMLLAFYAAAIAAASIALFRTRDVT